MSDASLSRSIFFPSRWFKFQNSRKSVEIRKQSVAIKKERTKRENVEGKITPCFKCAKDFIKYSERSFHLAQLLEEGERQKGSSEEISSDFPGSFTAAHASCH